MHTYNRYQSTQKGFSLLETLVAVVVVAVGLLAVASLQSNLVGKSADNKAKAEAMAIAQARIDDFRNYTIALSGEAAFDTLFAAVTDANPTVVPGANADFTRTDTIATAGITKDIDVKVAWTDRRGNTQNVVMSTSLGWQSPRAVADLARAGAGPLVPSPTGRASLGEGQIPTGAPTTDNGDGTKLYDDLVGNLKLVVGSDIVLTLKDACQIGGGNCTDFVKINGRIYIDDASTGVAPGEVFVTATDATFCTRYYMSGGTAVLVTNATTTALLTASNSDYKYFDYTCYLGGGWHGNIGLLLDGGLGSSDKICQGDPTSGNADEAPVLAARRVYRGMLYKHDTGNASLKAEDPPGTVLYFSIGVADELELPVPLSSDATHDFVISSFAASKTAGSNCISEGVMVRPDSNVGGTAGDLFAGVPTDFVCLNPSNIDAFDSSKFGVESTCPYNPADPPAAAYVMNGTITVLAEAADIAEVDLITVRTSDGPSTCLRGPFASSGTTHIATYSCAVFDGGLGWDGYIEVGTTSATSTWLADAGTDGAYDSRINLSTITGDTSVLDFNAGVGKTTLITGILDSSSATKVLSAATISGVGGNCNVATDGLSYACYTALYLTTDWSGTIDFDMASSFVCGPNVDVTTGIATLTNLAPGLTTLDLTQSNATSCP